MKTWFILLLLAGPVAGISAQENDTYTDNKILQMPATETYSTTAIATYIQDHFKTNKEKTRAAYTWIINNIKYSKDSVFHFRSWGNNHDSMMAAILRRRKGVCENYAELFTNIVNKCGVPAVMIAGYTKTGATVSNEGHGWAAVSIDNIWLLCDPTWDAGYYNSYHYFLVEPSEFINTHMPFDPMWQLLEHPVSHREFRQGYNNSKKQQPVFYYTDSISAYLQSDTLQQMEATSRRMQQAGLENEDLKIWYSYNQMKVQIVYQEENMQLFNEAVADLNKAKKLFNEFVQYRNDHFTPTRQEATVKAMFTAIEKYLTGSRNKMNGIGKKTENYQYDTDALKEELDKLSAKVKEQEAFLNTYFSSPETERQKLL